MQNTAQQIHPDRATIPSLKVVEKPLYFVGTQMRSYTGGKSWEAFKDDLSALYAVDGRWAGGRFAIWTLEADAPRGLVKKRSGYFDTLTGAYFYGSRETS